MADLDLSNVVNKINTDNRNIIENIKMRSKIELKPCPFCGNKIDEEKDMYMPERDWKPTFYDPDSGGDPISIHCKCGLEFSTGTYDYQEFINSWNKRSSK